MNICKSYLDALKTEVLKKQEEIQIRKQQENCLKPVREEKKNIVLKNTGVEERNLKDIEATEGEDIDLLLRSKQVLVAKSKLYEKLKNSDDGEAKSKYLIDFDLKNEIYSQEEPANRDEPTKDDGHQPEAEDKYDSDENSDPENDWVDFVDTLGRSRRCLRKDLPQMKTKDEKLANTLHPPSPPPKPEPTPELLSWDMQREALRKKWEEQESLLLGKTDVHYQDLLFDEARSHGVGYFKFSSDENERLRQQADLRKMRKETMEKQREARRREREVLGLPPEEEPESPEAEMEVDFEVKEQNIKDLEETIKKMAPVRPWDIGKNTLPLMTQEEWVEKKRQERPEEFAPPSSLLKNALTINLDDKCSETQNATTSDRNETDVINDKWNALMPSEWTPTTTKLNYFTTKKSLPFFKQIKIHSGTEILKSSTAEVGQSSSLVKDNTKFEHIDPISKRRSNDAKKVTNDTKGPNLMQEEACDEETDEEWIGPMPESWKLTTDTPCSISNLAQPLPKLIPSGGSDTQWINPISSGTETPGSMTIKDNQTASEKNTEAKSEVDNFGQKPRSFNRNGTNISTLHQQVSDESDDEWIGPKPDEWKQTTENSVCSITDYKQSTTFKLIANNESAKEHDPFHSGTEPLRLSTIKSDQTIQPTTRGKLLHFPPASKLLSCSGTGPNVIISKEKLLPPQQESVNDISDDEWIGPKPEGWNETMNIIDSNRSLGSVSQNDENNQTKHAGASSIISSEQNLVQNLITHHKPYSNLQRIKNFTQVNNYPSMNACDKNQQHNSDRRKITPQESSGQTNKYTPESIDALLSNIRSDVSKIETGSNKTPSIEVNEDRTSSTTPTTSNPSPHFTDGFMLKKDSSDASKTNNSLVKTSNFTNFPNKTSNSFKRDQKRFFKSKRKDPPNLNLNLIPDTIMEEESSLDPSTSTSVRSRVNPSKRKWAEIPPPPCMSYYANDKRNLKQPPSGLDLKDSISVGMDFLNSQKNERSKKKIKGLLDII